ncbi:MAG: TetR/AcrR family transcriptional regulator [Lachnospiraceae bacterium]|nr:TetR/AcrR family transcriptional regulator [Lachnospiraceae bacterium]
MPKIYSDKERTEIVERLKKEANILMQEKGVKKTTVDELVKRAGIPKGTFYLFYPSKEMLLFDCAQEFHDQVDEYIQNGMNRIISDLGIDPTKKGAFSKHIDEVVDVIMGAIQITRNSCLRVLLDPKAMDMVLSKLPKEVLEDHVKHDRQIGAGLFETVIEDKGLNVDEMVGAFTMVLFGGMYKEVIGEENINGSTRFLIKGLVMQIFG